MITSKRTSFLNPPSFYIFLGSFLTFLPLQASLLPEIEKESIPNLPPLSSSPPPVLPPTFFQKYKKWIGPGAFLSSALGLVTFFYNRRFSHPKSPSLPFPDPPPLLKKKEPFISLTLEPPKLFSPPAEGETFNLPLQKGEGIHLKQSFYPLHQAAEENNRSEVDYLLQKGADVFKKDIHGRIPLVIAIQKNNVALVRIFLKKHPEQLSCKDPLGKTPLFYARRASMIDLLVAEGASPQAQDLFGDTPLHEAGTIEIVEALLKNGAPREVKNHRGQTPAESQRKRRRRDDIATLIEKGTT